MIGWVVDVQNDFMDPDGKLYIPGSETIIQNLELAFAHMLASCRYVVTTGDYHMTGDEELSDTPDMVNTFPPHCMAGTVGACLISGVDALDENFIFYVWTDNVATPDDTSLVGIEKYHRIHIDKNRFDVFQGNPLTNAVLWEIAAYSPETFIVCGVATDVCVTAAVEGLIKRGHNVVVLMDAVWGLEIEPTEAVFARWEELGVQFTTTDKFIKGRI